MLKNNDDALHASYSRHLAQGNTIKGLIKFAKDKGIGSPEVWVHNGHYALRYQGRDGETKQLSLGDKYNGARRMILSLAGPQKPKVKPAPAGGTRVLGAVKPSMKGTQKPYISSSRGEYEVLDTQGKTAFKTRDKEVAQAWFKKNYNRMMDGLLSLAAPAGLKPEQVTIGGKPHTVKFVVDTTGSNDEWTATAFNAEGKKVGSVKAYNVGKETRSILLKKIAGLRLSLADPLSKGLQKGARVNAEGKTGKITAIGLSSTGKRLAVVQFDDGTKKGVLQSKLKALSLSQVRPRQVKLAK